MKEMLTLKCRDCGKTFEWPDKNKKYCPVCADIRTKNQAREYREKQKSLKFKKTPVNFSVTEVVSMLERYNRKNKTKYTYGQFSELIRMGKV